MKNNQTKVIKFVGGLYDEEIKGKPKNLLFLTINYMKE